MTFLSTKVIAKNFYNFDTNKLPSFGIKLPKLPSSSRIGAGSTAQNNDPGYFDILYLDDDCLIIKQNQPGGMFINIRSNEPMYSFLP